MIVEKIQMSIVVKCFANIREQLNICEKILDYDKSMTVSSVWNTISNQSPPNNLLSALNHQYVEFSEDIEDGDEIAFFPAVTGG